jgi:predicted amidohydrolase YtcJ
MPSVLPMKTFRLLSFSTVISAALTLNAQPDLILHHAKVVAVDRAFTIAEAFAVRDGRIVAVGANDDVLASRGPNTQVIDLHGKMVLPGLIDSHVHPESASMTEFDHPIPDMETIQNVLDYIAARAKAVGPGKWVEVHQVFITRLREQRYPTRAELDRVAPDNPVLFATGPDASLNTLALKRSGIDKDFRVADGGPGKIETNSAGEPTGILRSCTRYVKVESAERKATPEEQDQRLMQLFADYNSVGITSIGDRDASATAIRRYERLLDQGKLSVRVSISEHINSTGPIEEIQKNIRHAAQERLARRDPMAQIIGIKTYLDGGMLTGSAYMREPWGVSDIYAITDPTYRGLLFIPKERLLPMVQAAVESGLQFTAHTVGDGAVQTLMDVYEEVNRTTPVRSTRPCITHSNFMSREAVEAMPRLGVLVDIQPAWLYLDTRTLVKQFGYDRLRYFQPLRSIFDHNGIAGGGSDHMQKIGSLRSINPYNPFLAIWTTLTRQARWYDGALHPEEALTREQALRFYTANNAYLLFRENDIGSLEQGKQADFVVLDRDILSCPADAIRDTQVLVTYLGGKRVFGQP